MALRLAVLALVAALIVIALLFAGKGFNLIDFLKKLHGASL
jgi:hypothetical protein